MTKKVYVVGPDWSVDATFRELGFGITKQMVEADIVVLTGGCDVSEKLYNEKRHPRMYTSDMRDQYEVEQYYAAVGLKKDIVGICRGAQLIHVLNGNKLWQDVDNHTRNHEIIDLETGDVHFGTSCHHQMMRVDSHPHGNEQYEVVSLAAECTYRAMHDFTMRTNTYYTDDIECLWYPRLRALCYQGHPEYGMKSDTEYFYSLLKRYNFLDEGNEQDPSPVTMPPEPASLQLETA